MFAYRTRIGDILFTDVSFLFYNAPMMKKILSVVLVSLVAIGGLSFLVGTRTIQAQQLTIWEYKFEGAASERRANELGAQGWELVAIQSPSTAGLNNHLPIYVYKRAKPYVDFPPN